MSRPLVEFDAISDESSITMNIITDNSEKLKIAHDIDENNIKILCRSTLYRDYVSDQIKENNSIVVVQYMKNAKTPLVGIAVLHPRVPDTYYISVICAQQNSIKLGHMLMNTIYNVFCKGSCTLQLTSLPQAIGFYKKMGFIKVNEADKGNLDMIYEKPLTVARPRARSRSRSRARSRSRSRARVRARSRSRL